MHTKGCSTTHAIVRYSGAHLQPYNHSLPMIFFILPHFWRWVAVLFDYTSHVWESSYVCLCMNPADKRVISSLSILLGSLTQTVRNFAKSLEGWLRSALAGAPEVILKIKVRVVDPTRHIVALYMLHLIYGALSQLLEELYN